VGPSFETPASQAPQDEVCVEIPTISMRDPVLAVMDQPEVERGEEGHDEADAGDHVHRRRVGEAEEEG
jgi:hypothetical protein